MRTRALWILVAALFVAAVPAMAAPFGHLDGLQPPRNNAGAGVLGVSGWALDSDGVQRVDVYVDGLPLGKAVYGLPRNGVTVLYPGYPNSARPGFGFMLDTTHLVNGLHTVKVRVLAVDGEVTWFAPVTIEVLNTTSILDPFGKIEYPQRHAELRGKCDVTDPARRYTVVEGWVLDSGVELGDHGGVPGDGDPPGDAGVGYVELLLDGVIWANTRRDCHFSPAKGGFSDCYGLRRQAIERSYPSLPDAPHAGFRFVIDVGALIALGYTPGSHVLTIRAGDIAGQVSNPDEAVVTFTCDEFYDNEEAFGFIDKPIASGVYGGVIPVYGWALDWEGVSNVSLLVDGQSVGTATYGFLRSGVAARFPSYPNALGSGWQIMLDTTLLTDGWHELQVVVMDVLGNVTTIGKRTIMVDNIIEP